MWDQKTGMNISAVPGSERITGINREIGPNQQDKKNFESSGDDSGFLSGPQNLYSSESIDTHLDSVTGTEKFRDSGAIDTNDNTKDTKSDSMILDSGVDLGLSEWFCELNLKNSTTPLNNLGSCGKQESTEAKLAELFQKTPLWQFCFYQDEDGDTQLHLAIMGKYVEAVRAIIRLAPIPAFLDFRNDRAHSPLHLAVLTRQHAIVRYLLVAGAKTTIPDSEGNTPLHLACMISDKACVEALTLPVSHEELQRNLKFSDRIPQVIPPDLEQRNYDGLHCVHIAAQRNDIEILRHLVWLGADINAREGKSGYTALHFACENRNEQLAQFLLNECSQLNIETCTYGLLTAYQLAAEQKNHDIMCDLQRHGAELLSPPDSDNEDYMDSSEEDFQDY